MGSRKPDPELAKIEAWLKSHATAGSALGRHVCDDHSMISRWRGSGPDAVTTTKRALVLEFIDKHPEGIPGYTGATRRASRRFQPGATKDIRSYGETSNSRSTELPVPSLEALEKDNDRKWVMDRAYARGVPLVVVLCELVSLGIMVTKETELSEADDDKLG
jgi:hypothetical protein